MVFLNEIIVFALLIIGRFIIKFLKDKLLTKIDTFHHVPKNVANL